ncbi:GntR family transcriptional regulator [Halocynthiibacter sp. C4]|uniref:GntR family transcriptional regulator n=1 Tax=Halocynthiibacter sp. C4 TaxID=2992758 RepID=UPI00237A27A0|nr:GntR family transcriptional regulator [Halocynthiibacter sp. C4]MDE0590016.1 GntR family transcriptional regulator [Halocynthiibacter sp. C4]
MPRRKENVAQSKSLDQVIHDLELEIVLGRMRPRERLVEDELMEKLNAKRHMVRSALNELEKRGLIERRQNKGARVREYTQDEVKSLYEFRVDLHRLAVSKIKLPLDEAVLARLSELASTHEAACADGRLADVIECNNAFHDCLFDQCGNPFLANTIRQVAAATNSIRSYRIADPKLLKQAASEHRAMIEAASGGDLEVLDRLVEAHIIPSRDMYLRDRKLADATKA